MHERTSRAIARLLFVLCCALPTAATLAVILITWTPWYHRRCLAALEASLYRETGLIVRLDDFTRLSPSRLQLHGVRLLEPEMGREVARVRIVWWVSENDRMVIRMSQPELQSSHLPEVWTLVHERFLCRPEIVQAETRFSATDLTIHSRSGALTLRDFDAWIRPLAKAVEVHAQCSPAASRDDDPPWNIEVVRDRAGEHPWTRFRLHTEQTPLPCSVLAEYLPVFERLGQDATFTGSLVWQQSANDWWVDLAGAHFRHVDLGRLCETIPHRLTGEAELQFQRCRWKPGEVVDISGEIRASRGYVSRSLLRAAQQHLGFQTANLPESAGDQPYDELSLHFDLFGSDLEFQGTCNRLAGHNHLTAGTALCVGGQPLAISGDGPLLALSLSRALAPEHSDLVPVAGQTHWLMGFLLPPQTPRLLEQPGAISPRIRTARDFREGQSIQQP